MQPKINYPGDYFATEVSNALFKLAVGTSIVLNGTIATVISASHLLSTGDMVTFSGAATVTAINGATWGPVTVTSSSVYTFPCALTGSVTGSPVQEKLYFPPSGYWLCVLGANGQIEYNPDGNFGLNSASGYKGNVASGVGTVDSWRILIAASAAGDFFTDGYAVRFRENGTTATSYFSQVK